MTPAAYPSRPKFYAAKFVRLLTKACVANELGQDVFTLLTVIAFTEDARGYRTPVSFYNGQLRPLIGSGSDDALARTRDRAVEAGWLNYTPGSRTRPAKYFVTVPHEHESWDDAPTDEPVELPQKCGSSRGVRAEFGSELPQKCGSSRGQPAEPPSLFLSSSSARAGSDPEPEPAEQPEPAGEAVEGIPSLAVFIAAWNGAGLMPRTASGTLRGHWQYAWRNFRGFRDRWRAAVERAGRQDRCRPGGSFPLTPEFFLKNEDAVERVLAGEFDDRPTARPLQPARPAGWGKDF